MYRYNSERSGIGMGARRTGSIFGALRAAFDSLAIWRERLGQRRTLARLDDRMLRDIGLTSADVDAEISKPFWR